MKVPDEKIIAVLLSSQTNREAAQRLKMNERYLYTRLQDEAFQRKYRAAQREILDDVVFGMQNNLKEAAAVIAEVMRDPKNSPQTRLNAADMLQRNYLKLSEHTDILNRIERLEMMENEY